MTISRAVRITDELDRRMVDLADSTGRSMSDIMREALEMYFGMKMRLHQMDVPEDGPSGIVPLTSGNADTLAPYPKGSLASMPGAAEAHRGTRESVPVRSSPEVREVPDRPTRTGRMGSARRCQCPREGPARDLRCDDCGLPI